MASAGDRLRATSYAFSTVVGVGAAGAAAGALLPADVAVGFGIAGSADQTIQGILDRDPLQIIGGLSGLVVSGAGAGLGGNRAGGAGGGGGGGPRKLYRLLTEPTPEGNVLSNAAKGLPPRGPEITDRSIHEGMSMDDTVEGAVAKIPVLERNGKTVQGIGEFVPGPTVSVAKTFGRGHYTVGGSTDALLESWVKSLTDW